MQVVKLMKEELHLKDHSIIMRITALHSFWRANNIGLTEAVMKYEGTPSLQRTVKMRESAEPPAF
jgi:hypothetical protein